MAKFESGEKFVRACLKPKLKNYEAEDYRFQYKKVGKNFISKVF